MVAVAETIVGEYKAVDTCTFYGHDQTSAVLCRLFRKVGQGLCDALSCICEGPKPVRAALRAAFRRTKGVIGSMPHHARASPAGDRSPQGGGVEAMSDRAAGRRAVRGHARRSHWGGSTKYWASTFQAGGELLQCLGRVNYVDYYCYHYIVYLAVLLLSPLYNCMLTLSAWK